MSNIIKGIILCITLLNLSCSQRGYRELASDLPELFHGLDPHLYKRYETPENVIIQTKKIEEEVDEFYSQNYKKHKNIKKYVYYTPILETNTIQRGLSSEFKSYPKIENRLNIERDSILINK